MPDEQDGSGETGEQGYLVVANARAGTAEQPRVDAAVATLATAGPTRLWRTGGVDELDRALDGAVAADQVIVAVGGDGSLHAIVSRLWAREELAGARLGLIPCGTGNDFARGVDVPLEPIDAARRIVDGRPRSIDVLVDGDGHVVVNAVHAGIGAAAAERAVGMKDRFGKAAYPLGAMFEVARGDGWALTVTVDGEVLELPGERVLMVGVGNGPSIGGGTVLFPGADPADGLLDVVVSCATGPAARLAFGNDLRVGEHLGREDVVAARGREVRIAGDPVAHDADGEISDEVRERTYQVHPGAWTLVA
ncbi:MAG: diacylglycerol kinase family protein [Acidimicrobiales bacterium]